MSKFSDALNQINHLKREVKHLKEKEDERTRMERINEAVEIYEEDILEVLNPSPEIIEPLYPFGQQPSGLGCGDEEPVHIMVQDMLDKVQKIIDEKKAGKSK